MPKLRDAISTMLNTFYDEKFIIKRLLKVYSDKMYTLSYSENYITIDGKHIVIYPLSLLCRLNIKIKNSLFMDN